MPSVLPTSVIVAIQVLGEIPAAGALAIQTLIDGLDDGDKVIGRLGDLGAEGRAAIAPLRWILGDEHLLVRDAAQKALGKIDPAWPRAVR